MVIYTFYSSLKIFFSLGGSLRKKMPLLWHDLNYCFDPGISSITFAITFTYLSHNVSSIKWEFCPHETTLMTRLIAHIYIWYAYSLYKNIHDKLNSWLKIHCIINYYYVYHVYFYRESMHIIYIYVQLA